MAENLIANGNFWDGFNGYAKNDISYELKKYDGFFDYCEFKGNGQNWNRFYTYFKDGTMFVTGETYRIGFWGRSDNSNSINIGCNDDPLTFSLTPQWKWYESEYVSPLNQAVSIINPDTTNTVCISGIWIQLGNDPIIPEVSPYIQTIELGNNQINLDSSQIEQGGSVGGPFGVDYSILKNSSSNNLFFMRLRSRNLYKIQTASRNVEITGDFTGFQLYVTEYDSEKKSIAYNGWHDNFKLKVRNDTRYISLLIRNLSDSTITPSQFITRGGVLVMSDYPTLPIVTTPDGFEYAEGLNLWLNSANDNFGGQLGTWKRELKDSGDVPSGKFVRCTFEIKDNSPVFGPCSSAASHYKYAFIMDMPMHLSLYVRASKAISCPFHIEFGDQHTVINLTTQWQKFDSSLICKRTPEYTEHTAVAFYSGLWEIGDYIDISSPMLTYGTKFHPYRPNPADMVGGGRL